MALLFGSSPSIAPCRHIRRGTTDTAFVLERFDTAHYCLDGFLHKPERIDVTAPSGAEFSVAVGGSGGNWMWEPEAVLVDGPITEVGVHTFVIVPAETDAGAPAAVPHGPASTGGPPASPHPTSTRTSALPSASASTATGPTTGVFEVRPSTSPQAVVEDTDVARGASVVVSVSGRSPSSTVLASVFGPAQRSEDLEEVRLVSDLQIVTVDEHGEGLLTWETDSTTERGLYFIWVEPRRAGCTLDCPHVDLR